MTLEGMGGLNRYTFGQTESVWLYMCGGHRLRYFLIERLTLHLNLARLAGQRAAAYLLSLSPLLLGLQMHAAMLNPGTLGVRMDLVQD